MAYLAITSWPFGEVDRARSLIERMQTRMGDLTHVGMLAYGRMHAALFEMIRGDPARAAPNVFELVRLADEHDLPMFRAFGVFLQGWSRGERLVRRRTRGHASRRQTCARTERSGV